MSLYNKETLDNSLKSEVFLNVILNAQVAVLCALYFYVIYLDDTKKLQCPDITSQVKLYII